MEAVSIVWFIVVVVVEEGEQFVCLLFAVVGFVVGGVGWLGCVG